MSVKGLYYMTSLPSRILKELIFDVYILSNKTKKITYITSVSMGVDRYIVDKLCGDDVTITKIKRIYIWELRKFVKEQDAVLVDMYKYFARFFDDGFLVPEYVDQVLDIDKPVNKAVKINNSELNKVHKYGYEYEISNDLDKLKFFYEKMYIPYIKKRHGDSAHIENFNYLKNFFKNGELVLVKFNDKYIAAVLCEINNNVYHMRKNGVLDESFIKKGVLVATYYFSILRAKEINAKMVDFGLSRPFLLDGVLRHKNLWGARICEAKAIQRIIYLKNVLFEQPFIYVENKKFKAVVFSEDDKLIKEYVMLGLEFNVIQKNK